MYTYYVCRSSSLGFKELKQVHIYSPFEVLNKHCGAANTAVFPLPVPSLLIHAPSDGGPVEASDVLLFSHSNSTSTGSSICGMTVLLPCALNE